MSPQLTRPPISRDVSGLAIAIACAAAGALLGGLAGFVLRPYYPAVGQLPLGVVLSGGADLEGASIVLKGAAKESLMYVIQGGAALAFIGNVAGSIIGYRYASRGF